MPPARAKASAKPQRKKSKQLDASDWAEAGLNVLARAGIDAVRIEPLAKMLQVTKGSFYWHFRDRAHLLELMLSTWRRNATSAVIARLETHSSPAERLRQLIDLPLASKDPQRGQSLELAIRLWSRRDAQAAAALEEIDQQRLTYTASILRKMGVAESKIAAQAYLIYAFILAEALIPVKAAGQSTIAKALHEMLASLGGIEA